MRKGSKRLKKVELLAPVGSMESLYAAIENRADAVYLGGERFSARKHAKNFSDEELKIAVEYAHLRGVRVHVAVNILMSDKEIKEALDYIKYLNDIDVDAVIVQDIGLASMIIELFPELEVHGSTQMTINNLEGVRYLEKIGYKRVVLARETPLDEIIRIKENSKVDIEVFVHGALCVAYSGQCLMSSLIGGRSGNRGNCAQPCRMKYSIVDKDGKTMNGWEEKYVLSTKDLSTINQINSLIQAGVDSFKIEGRMKRPEYVATVVSKYRKAIDEGVESLTDSDYENLKQIFNRDFTKGLMFKDFSNHFISHDRPDNRGILIGEVVYTGSDKTSIKLYKDLNANDGIELSLNDNSYKGYRIDKAVKTGEIIDLYNIRNIKDSSKVYRTSDSFLLKKAEESYKDSSIKKYIDVYTKIKIGEKPYLRINYKGVIVEVENDFIVEEAKKTGLDENGIYKQYAKLGDSIFNIANIEFLLDENSFLPVSVLNELRRDAIEKLEDEISNLNKREEIINFSAKKKEILKLDRNKSNETKDKFNIRVSNLDQLEKMNLDYVDRLYVTNNIFTEEILKRVRNKDIDVYLWTDKILFKEHLEEIKKLIDNNTEIIDGVSVSNIGSLYYIKDNFPNLKIHADIGFNIYNSYSAKYMLEKVDSITLSTELTLAQINEIKSKVGNKNIEIITYGYLPSMLMLNCPMSLIKGCDYKLDCSRCKFNASYGLRDRMNKTFKMQRDNGITTLYNSDILMVLQDINNISKNKDLSMRLDFTLEDAQAYKTLDKYFMFYNNLLASDEMEEYMEQFKKMNNITNGHYYRGII